MAALLTTVAAVIGSLLSCVPALHIYNVMGLIVICAHRHHWQWLQREDCMPALAIGFVVSYAMVTTLPSILLSAPDESAVLSVQPGQKMMMDGHGLRAVLLSCCGSLASVLVLVCLLGPVLPRILPDIYAVLRPHFPWMIWLVILFMLMSEWPRRGRLERGGWPRFAKSWSSLGAGLLTFGLSGCLGLILFNHSPLPVEYAFQHLMPAFAGLFSIPWLMMNLMSRARVPPQSFSRELGVGLNHFLGGLVSGVCGGLFAALVPAVSGGVGGMLAGHGAAMRDSRAFIVGQGASRMTYYLGGLMIFFVPGVSVSRGAGWVLRPFHEPQGQLDYLVMLGCAALAAGISFALILPLSASFITRMQNRDVSELSRWSLVMVLVLVPLVSGLSGVLVCAAATLIGFIPLLFHSRRLNGLGLILLPIAISMID
jgi:putative membrane protein